MAPLVPMMVLMVSMSDRYLVPSSEVTIVTLAIISLAVMGWPLFVYQSFYISDPALPLLLYSSTIICVK